MFEEGKNLLQNKMSSHIIQIQELLDHVFFEYSWELCIAEFLASQPSDMQMWLVAYIKVIITKNLDFKVSILIEEHR